MNILEGHIKNILSLNKSKNIVLIRHGQSMGNYAGTIVGWTDVRLSNKGEIKKLFYLSFFFFFLHKIFY